GREVMPNFNLQLDTLLVWMLVGLVAGFFSSHAMLGHGVGIIADILVGLAGAIIGGFFARYVNVRVPINGQPISSEMIGAFVGALILLLVLRHFGFGGERRRPI